MVKIVTYEYLFDPNNTADINANYELECELSQKQIDYSRMVNPQLIRISWTDKEIKID